MQRAHRPPALALRVTVVTPVFAQAGLLPRALASLRAQDLPEWELVVVDDGSPEPVEVAEDERIRVLRHEVNRGLGASLNNGLDAARAPVVAYLPADGEYEPGHLRSLLDLLDGAVLASCGPELVHVAHRVTGDRWVERPELESDDLGELLLDRLRPRASTDVVTSRSDPGPRRHLLRPSSDGGLNAFRRLYRARGPLRIRAEGALVADEHRRYARFAGAPAPEPGGLKVLLAGELAYNPERILALEARGVTMSGLWIDDPLGFMTVGPLPFGHVTDVEDPRDGAPDVIYALLNWRAVPLAHRLLGTGVPLVFHFKEAPQRCIERGDWELLAEVAGKADTLILSSEEERDWFLHALDRDPATTYVLDGDLPKRDWLDASAPSARIGELDTVLLGRPYGFDDALIAALGERGVRVHRPQVEPDAWVSELSRYAAGWLHPVRSTWDGDPATATWDDLNVPARLPTLVAGGLPLIAPRGRSAVTRVAEELGCGVLYDDLDDLAAQLRDAPAMQARREAAWAAREQLTFDHHADRLIGLLERTAGR